MNICENICEGEWITDVSVINSSWTLTKEFWEYPSTASAGIVNNYESEVALQTFKQSNFLKF